MQRKTANRDRFILIIPASSRFLPLARHAVQTLVHEAKIGPERIFELQLAVMEACNLVSRAYADREAVKAISISGLFDGGQAQITIDDGGGGQSGKKVRQKISRRQLTLESNLALKTARLLCDDVALSSGITGGLRIELTKQF